jgi:hypothetical protein
MQITLKLPTDYNSSGTTSVRLPFFSSTTSGNVVFGVATVCTPDDASATDDPSFNTVSNFDSAVTIPGTANRITKGTIASLTMTGCAANNLLHLKVNRNAGAGSDSMSGTARGIGLEITIPRN